MYWYSTGDEADKEECAVNVTHRRCPIGKNVTFFRNTDVQVWLAFTPAITVTGLLGGGPAWRWPLTLFFLWRV